MSNILPTDLETLRRLAKLSRLAISRQEEETFAADISRILDLFAVLEEADTSDIVPMAHVLEVIQPLRSDVVADTNYHQQIMALAPETEEGYFLVPQVIE